MTSNTIDAKNIKPATNQIEITRCALPKETRDLMLELGWVHESEVDLLSGTRGHRARKRWGIKGAMIGSQKFYRIEELSEYFMLQHESGKGGSDSDSDERPVIA